MNTNLLFFFLPEKKKGQVLKNASPDLGLALKATVNRYLEKGFKYLQPK